MSHPAPTVLLDPDLVIRAATQSYYRVTRRSEEELLAVQLFEAFPESSDTARLGARQELADSLGRVLRTNRPHQLGSLRYDISDPARPGRFLERRWAVVSTPIPAGGRVAGVMVRIEDLSRVDQRLVVALRCYQEALEASDEAVGNGLERSEAVAAFAAMVESNATLAEEVAHLRTALRNRPIIEQAKGIVMADLHCSGEEAFGVIRRMSMNHNVRVADVAAAMVYQTESRPSRRTASPG